MTQPRASSSSESLPDAPTMQAVQGLVVDASDPVALQQAIELAFDYRGDVTIIRRSSPDRIEGYVFDRRQDRASSECIVRLVRSDSDERITIPMSDIASIAFTGRDNASGKSFETWVKKYIEKKLAGEHASIASEPLDDKPPDDIP